MKKIYKKNNPQITRDFLESIKKQDSVVKNINGLRIKTCPGVFPPQSNYSRSSKGLHSVFGILKNKKVLDLGTGTGVQAIVAAKKGAKKIVASDISEKAVKCALENVNLNNFGKKIKVVRSDLFDDILIEKFDLIIANLPIVDFPAKDIVGLSLYDSGFKIHRKFFKRAPEYLSKEGFIVLSHANLQGEEDFKIFEKMLKEFNFEINKFVETKSLGYIWRFYKIKVKQ